LLAHSRRSLRIVKPIVARKRIVTLDRRGGDVVRSGLSPKRSAPQDLFLDLVHFADVFPMRRLTLEFALTESLDTRIDRASPRRRRQTRYATRDQELNQVGEPLRIRTARQWLGMIPIESLPSPFDTAELAVAIERP